MTPAYQKADPRKIFILTQLPAAGKTLLRSVGPGERDGPTLHTQGVWESGSAGSEDQRQPIPYEDTKNRSTPGYGPHGNLPKVNGLGF